MYRLLFLIAVVLSSCYGQPTEVSAQHELVVAHNIVNSTVLIQVKQEGTWLPVGSGVVVEGPLGPSVLTAYHVAMIAPGGEYLACSMASLSECLYLDTDPIVDIENRGGSIIDPSQDYAVFKIKGTLLPHTRPAYISHISPRVGLPVWQAGFPEIRPFVNRAEIAWTFGDEGAETIILEGYAMPGSSGGGVFDEQGKLIAITVAIPVASGPLFGFPTYSEDQVVAIPVNSIECL